MPLNAQFNNNYINLYYIQCIYVDILFYFARNVKNNIPATEIIPIYVIRRIPVLLYQILYLGHVKQLKFTDLPKKICS